MALRIISLVCIAGTAELVLVNREQLRDVFILEASEASPGLFSRTTPTIGEGDLPRAGEPLRVHATNMLGSMLAGVSPLRCWEPLQLKQVARLGAVDIRGAGAIAVSRTDFSPNHIAAEVAVGQEPVRFVLNQNFADGWSTNVGAIERDPDSGRPSVLLPAGYTGTIAFSFFPTGLWLGLGIWVTAIALSAVAWRRAGANSA
jgi:hypothetical protein